MGVRTAENALNLVSLCTPMIMASDCFANKIAAANPRRKCFESSKQTIILLFTSIESNFLYLSYSAIIDSENKSREKS